MLISIAGYWLTTSLVPVIAQYTLKSGLSGKDLGKRGTSREKIDVPEALGVVAGTVYLICTILSQFFFIDGADHLTISNSALFSVCFMIFLGFVDDTVDLKWRFKLILPTVASLPLLVAYSGFTSVFIPGPFRQYIMAPPAAVDGSYTLTLLGRVLHMFFTVDSEAKGAIVDLGAWFFIYMGMLAVFCTNAINILAGINGLECGQSYVIGCSILFFKLYDMHMHRQADDGGGGNFDQLFAILMVLPFIGASLGLLRHNWFPASVFVGDTFCYFAGMTFAVIGIHGHFSKTLLLLLLPQLANFLYSIPQLAKIVPCPRHRLPRFDASTGLMRHSAFPCKKHELLAFKVHPDDEECPNLTLICAVLRAFGPMTERSLCLTLLAIQCCSSVLAFYVRYVLLGDA